MDFNRIQATHSKERQKDSLQHLDAGFYQDAGDLLTELREEREELAEKVDDPFSCNEIRQLTDQIQTLEEKIESLHERRMGKIVKAASLEVAGMPVDIDATTIEERELFDSLVSDLEANRERVLTTLEEAKSQNEEPETEGEADEDVDVDVDVDVGSESGSSEDRVDGVHDSESNTVPETDSVAVESDDEESESSQSESNDDGVSRVTVQITTDVGSIFGVDMREYDLQEDDVVTLPEQNASALVEKDAAQALQ